MKARRARAEAVLQRQIIATLRALLPPGWLVHHSPNGGYRTKAEAACFKAQGVAAGFPDLIVIGPGSILFMELKAPRRRLRDGTHSLAQADTSDAQEAVLALLQDAGWPVAVVRSIEEAQGFLRQHRVPMRGRVQ